MNGEHVVLKLQGMDDGPNPEPGWAERIDNLAIDSTGTWHNCTDWESIYAECTAGTSTPPSSGSGVEYQSLHWWGQRGTARQWLLWERATSATACALEVFDGIARTYQTLATGRQRVETPNPGTCYIPLNGWLYLINGHDQPVRWNGRWPNYGSALVQVGFDQLPPSPAVCLGAAYNPIDAIYVAAASGVSAPATTFRYGYAITYVNEVGAESPPSPIVFAKGSNVAAPGGGFHICIRLSTPPAYVASVRIYRTVDLGYAAATAEGARFSLYHLIDLPSATSQVWEDGLPDGLLGHELDESALGLYPNGATYAAVFKGTLFLAGVPSYPDRVFHSHPGLVEQFPAENTFDLGTGTGGEFMGMRATQNALLVFRRRGVYLIKGDPLNGFYAQTVSEDVGCIAPGAIVDLPGDRGVLFFSQDGPMLLSSTDQGTSDGAVTLTSLVGKIARTWLVEVDVGAMMGARSVRFDRDQEILFILPARTGRMAQLGLVYHYLHGYWSIRDYEDDTKTYRITAMCRIDDHRGLVAWGSRNGVYVSAGRKVSQGNILAWRYRMGWWGDRWERSTIGTVEIVGSLSSSHAADPSGLMLRYGYDRQPLSLTSYTDAWSGLDYEATMPSVGDSAVLDTEYTTSTWENSYWDTGRWARPEARVYPVSLGRAAFEHQIEILGGGDDVGPVAMSHVAFWVVGGPRQAKSPQGLGAERS